MFDEGVITHVVAAATLVLVFASLGLAWSWLGRSAGIVSFGQTLFFGIGAYAVAVSNARGGSPWYGALGGGLIAVVLAVLAALLTLRGRGIVYSVLLLAAGVAAGPFVAAHAWLGPGSVYAFPAADGFLHLQFGSPWPYLGLAAIVYAAALGASFALRGSRVDYALQTARANPRAARAIGITILPQRLLVVAAAAFFTAVLGAFSAELARAVDPHATFGFALAVDIALIGAFGAVQPLFGTFAAALVYVVVSSVLPFHPPGIAGGAVIGLEALLVLAVTLAGWDGRLRRAPRNLTA